MQKSQVPRAQLNVNMGRAIAWFVGVIFYFTFFDKNSPPPRQFLFSKVLLKKLASVRGMLIA